ncbi:sensor histidine kinase [Clostridium manihotivorum]|uniref:histidine kinase n=1 Tax=Clostridium manihotivorum TaxID=2320868 RepID=A0A3R5UG46_9CLOT|nr:sensor histidine kinase [Clostridium manihotivorum]QAA32945.1 sensor histidine kinase [Clostridium manihotivorum]
MRKYSSTRGRLLFCRIMEIVALNTILPHILKGHEVLNTYTSFLLSLCLILVLNNIFRYKYLKDYRNKTYYLSYGLSVVIIGYFNYYMKNPGTDIYFILTLIEVMIVNRDIKTRLVTFHFIIYLISNLYKIDLFDSKAFISSLVNVALNYGSFFLIIFLFRTVVNERNKVLDLNQELLAKNLTLNEYSEIIKQLTLEQERTRIAQELHDSIGHSLIALKMNIEYAENILDKDPEKAKTAITKAKQVSKESMNSLREVVSILRKDNYVDKLRISINEIFNNFKESNSIEFTLHMDEEVEKVSPDIKNCIYKTIREAVTNGIKHGNATNFIIEINKKDNNISLLVQNNGLPCSNIIKSTGLKGIESRIKALGGNVSFISGEIKNFTISANIPNV